MGELIPEMQMSVLPCLEADSAVRWDGRAVTVGLVPAAAEPPQAVVVERW